MTFRKIGTTCGKYRSIHPFLLGSSFSDVGISVYVGKLVNGTGLFSSRLRLTGKCCSIRQLNFWKLQTGTFDKIASAPSIDFPFKKLFSIFVSLFEF